MKRQTGVTPNEQLEVTGGAGDATAANQVTGNNSLASIDTKLTSKTIKSVSGSFSADTDVIAAVASKRIKVIAYALFTFGTSATTILFKSNGTGGTEIWRVALQSVSAQVMGANLAIAAPSFLFGTVVGEKLTADTNTTDIIHYSLSYFDDDAT